MTKELNNNWKTFSVRRNGHWNSGFLDSNGTLEFSLNGYPSKIYTIIPRFGRRGDERNYDGGISAIGTRLEVNTNIHTPFQINIREENFIFDSIYKIFGMQDIKVDLKSFGLRYLVRSSDELKLKQVLTREMQRELFRLDMGRLEFNLSKGRFNLFRSKGAILGMEFYGVLRKESDLDTVCDIASQLIQGCR